MMGLNVITREEMEEKTARAAVLFAERRFREVLITPRLLLDLCKLGRRMSTADLEVIEGLPIDAELYATTWSPYRAAVVLTVAAAEFTPVPEGYPIPEQQVVYRRTEQQR